MAFGWKPPTAEELQASGLVPRAAQTGIVQTAPPGAFGANKNKQQAARTGNKRTGDPGAYGGQFSGQKAIDPANYDTPGVGGSNQWYGSGNEYGASLMAGDSNAFWTGYGDKVAGYQAGGNATPFLADKYNLQALGASMYGKEDFLSDESKLAGQTAIANAINKPGVQFFDPGTIVGSVLGALSSSKPEALMKQNPILANLLISVQGNPARQVETITGFLREALSATMPPDSLEAFMNQIAFLGEMFNRELLSGSMKNVDKANFAQFLIQHAGPTLGL